MFFTQDGQTLYLGNFEYNSALIINELKDIVLNNGGRVKENRHGYIVNRTLREVVCETTDKIEQLEAVSTDKAYLNILRDKLASYKKINNEPILLTTSTYINFVYEGYHYYYEISHNPFFEFHYIKTPIVNGKYSCDRYMDNDPKEWFLDCYLKCDCTEVERKEAANLIFNMLVNAQPSEHYRESKRVRVANLYDGGYHYENVQEPERFSTIDF